MDACIVVMLATFHVLTLLALLYLIWLAIDTRRMITALADWANGRKHFRDIAGTLNATGKMAR